MLLFSWDEVEEGGKSKVKLDFPTKYTRSVRETRDRAESFCLRIGNTTPDNEGKFRTTEAQLKHTKLLSVSGDSGSSIVI
jgi:acyl-coenzyme A thioesterase PaaI-like protein